MHRFFTEPSEIKSGFISLSAEDAAHIKSLRMRPTELFVVCDGQGADHVCRLSERGGGCVAEIVETKQSQGEPDVTCSVYIGLAKGDRLDYAVQKSVELGAYEIILFPSERCVSVPGDMSKKTARLQRIALETAKQCGRGRVPEVAAIPSFEAAVGKAASAELPLFFYECEREAHLKEVLENPEFWDSAYRDPELRYPELRDSKFSNPEFRDSKFSNPELRDSKLRDPELRDSKFSNPELRDSKSPQPSISIVTGPEGGFEPHECKYAQAAGMRVVSLGPRILRCETAPVAALAVIMYQTGNL